MLPKAGSPQASHLHFIEPAAASSATEGAGHGGTLVRMEQAGSYGGHQSRMACSPSMHCARRLRGCGIHKAYAIPPCGGQDRGSRIRFPLHVRLCSDTSVARRSCLGWYLFVRGSLQTYLISVGMQGHSFPHHVWVERVIAVVGGQPPIKLEVVSDLSGFACNTDERNLSARSKRKNGLQQACLSLHAPTGPTDSGAKGLYDCSTQRQRERVALPFLPCRLLPIGHSVSRLADFRCVTLYSRWSHNHYMRPRRAAVRRSLWKKTGSNGLS